jgi:hypothetical protein
MSGANPLKVAYSVSFFPKYTSNKVMQVCVITALKIKSIENQQIQMKKKNYSFIIILNIIRLIKIQSRVVSTRVVSGPVNTCREHAIFLHTTKGSENTNVQKKERSMVQFISSE